MRSKLFDAAIDLSVQANGTEQSFAAGDFPFRANMNVVLAVSSIDLGGDVALTFEGREDDTSAFVQITDDEGNAISFSGSPGVRYYNIVLPQELRAVVTETTGAGEAQVSLLQN